MTALKWDEVGSRQFEAGVDRGVFYLPDGSGVAWNGITSVEEENNDELESVYFDGLKFNDLVTLGEYSGTLKAFTFPSEFLPFDGLVADQQGVYMTHQTPGRFHLCYRTKIGNDVKGPEDGYKIHVIYNLTAMAASRNWETLGLEVDPLEFEWKITAIPEEVDGHRPTAHVIFDTRQLDPWLLQDIEEILYGDADTDANLPPLKALITFIRKWDRLIIVDNGDGTWDAISQDETAIVVQPDGYVTIIAADEDVTIVNPTTYTIKSSEKNDEDINL